MPVKNTAPSSSSGGAHSAVQGGEPTSPDSPELPPPHTPMPTSPQPGDPPQDPPMHDPPPSTPEPKPALPAEPDLHARVDKVAEAGMESFPASDPPSWTTTRSGGDV